MSILPSRNCGRPRGTESSGARGSCGRKESRSSLSSIGIHRGFEFASSAPFDFPTCVASPDVEHVYPRAGVRPRKNRRPGRSVPLPTRNPDPTRPELTNDPIPRPENYHGQKNLTRKITTLLSCGTFGPPSFESSAVAPRLQLAPVGAVHLQSALGLGHHCFLADLTLHVQYCIT